MYFGTLQLEVIFYFILVAYPNISIDWVIYCIGGYGGWSREGCKLVSDINGLSSCECDHLTNFGVLVVRFHNWCNST